MQTQLHPDIIATDAGKEAESILRACVHCGFCNATCPTYQVTGDELDGPRGRIYLIKGALEAGEASKVTRDHLDRCLTCRACETTCPSGVRYGRLLDIGRELVEESLPRSPADAVQRWALAKVVARPALFSPLLRLAQSMQTVLPGRLGQKVPERQFALTWPEPRHARRVLLLTGCAQQAATPDTNLALALVLDQLNISAVPGDGCCGALEWHLTQVEAATQRMAGNVRRWEYASGEVEAVISSASGCGVHVKDYGDYLRGTPEAAGARALAARTLDAAEFLLRFKDQLRPASESKRVAWHSPCTLQHGQRVLGAVEQLLTAVGHELVPVSDSHLCCGSAGTYSILQTALSDELGRRKRDALTGAQPDVIATANVGCQLQLQAFVQQPVVHWLQLLA